MDGRVWSEDEMFMLSLRCPEGQLGACSLGSTAPAARLDAYQLNHTIDFFMSILPHPMLLLLSSPRIDRFSQIIAVTGITISA